MDAQLEDVKEIDGHIYQLNIISTYNSSNSTHTGQLLKDGTPVSAQSFSSNLRWYLMKSTGKSRITSGVSGATLTMQLPDYMYGMALILEWVNSSNSVLLRKQIVLFDNSVVAKRITQAQSTATAAKEIADNTDQYFWQVQSGTDTGVHITAIPKDTFTTNPNGYNFLARSNGAVIRNGLSELSQFTTDGVFFNGYVNSQWQQIGAYTPTYTQIGSTDNGQRNVRIEAANGMFLRNGKSTLASLKSEGINIFPNGGSSAAFFGVRGSNAYARIGYDGAGYYNIIMTSDSTKIGTSSNNVTLTRGDMKFNQPDVGEVGQLTYGTYIGNRNLYGINLQLNRSNGTKKPAYVGFTARNSNNELILKWAYIQDNATIGNYRAGALNAGCDVDMNGFNIKEVDDIYVDSIYFADTHYLSSWYYNNVKSGLYTNGDFSTKGVMLVGNTIYNDTLYKLTVDGTTFSSKGFITGKSFVKYLNPARPTNGNFISDNSGGMYMFLATSSMTTGKPHSDAQVLQLNWDNSNSYAVQLAVTHNNGVLEHRYQDGITWGSWYRVYSEAFKPTKSDVGLSNVSNVTPAQIIDRLTTQSFTTGAVNVAANNLATGTLAVTKSGYTTIGVVGYDMSNYSGTGGAYVSKCSLGRCEVSGNTVHYDVYNHSGNAAKVQVEFVVLYKKN
jgi:hypothetical protein